MSDAEFLKIAFVASLVFIFLCMIAVFVDYFLRTYGKQSRPEETTHAKQSELIDLPTIEEI